MGESASYEVDCFQRTSLRPHQNPFSVITLKDGESTQILFATFSLLLHMYVLLRCDELEREMVKEIPNCDGEAVELAYIPYGRFVSLAAAVRWAFTATIK